MSSTASESTAAVNRTAGAAIRGYKYQFDKTIIELVEADDKSIITIEGIEDYDRTSCEVCESVQVKYLHAQSFSLAIIREAIHLMLANSTQNLNRWYRLYIHCGDLTKFVPKLDLDALKECLTKRSTGQPPIEFFKRYTVDQLTDFCTRLSLEAGLSYEDQREQAINALMREFRCSAEDCYDLFLPASRDVVSEIAIKSSISDRSLTKRNFLSHINRRHQMYTRWHAQHVGEVRFVAAMKRRVRAANAVDGTKQRVVIINQSSLATEDALSLAIRLNDSYSKKALKNTNPWTLIVDASEAEVAAFKCKLLSAGLEINDGWEHLSFRSDLFNARPIVNTKHRSKAVDISSFTLRVISRTTLVEYQDVISRPRHAFSAGQQTIPGLEDQTFYLAELSLEQVCEVMGV